MQANGGHPYTLEDLNELTGLSPHALTKVRRRKTPVTGTHYRSYEVNGGAKSNAVSLGAVEGIDCGLPLWGRISRPE